MGEACEPDSRRRAGFGWTEQGKVRASQAEGTAPAEAWKVISSGNDRSLGEGQGDGLVGAGVRRTWNDSLGAGVRQPQKAF